MKRGNHDQEKQSPFAGSAMVLVLTLAGNRLVRCFLVLFIAHGASVLNSQSLPSRTYNPNLADDDWSFLADPSRKEDLFDGIKYIPLGREDRYWTIGGEARGTFQGFKIHGEDDSADIGDKYFLQRYLFSNDFHLSRRLRVYGELQTGLIDGKQGTIRPTDESLTDVHQLFLEWRHTTPRDRILGLTIGRQELTIGSSRLVSASPSLNVKRSFDSITPSYSTKSWAVVASVAKIVQPKFGFFDDRPRHEEIFWGVGVARRSPVFKDVRWGVYYLSVDRKDSRFAQSIGREQRQTIGFKLSGSGSGFDINDDVILQWGTFSDASIRAWAVSTDTGYRFPIARWNSRVSLRVDSASGDRDPNKADLQSFNPLFPGSSFAGALGLLGPTNLTDLSPTFDVRSPFRVRMIFESPCYWRTSTGDGIYNPNTQEIFPASAGVGRAVGCNPGITTVWQATDHISITGAYTHFFPGEFLKTTIASQGFGFYSIATTFRF